MKFPRSSGILLHPTSLPSPHGIGDLGAEAFRFLDFLAAAGQRWWQVLPLGPTGFGDSPYQCFSCFAGNPLLIDLEALAARGWLDTGALRSFPPGPIDFQAVILYKLALLEAAYHGFVRSARSGDREDLAAFRSAQQSWLEDFALFLALKDAHGGTAWTQWEEGARRRDPQALATWRERLHESIEARVFQQWIFFRQWERVRARAAELGICVMGDTPIYAASDSADAWCHPDLFFSDVQAGVPPDYFSATGQLWGNPLYDWEEHARTGYAWWIARLQATFELFDGVRIDHFRGFQAYWAVPAGETTAERGEWRPGPGAKFFEGVHSVIAGKAIVAENLGVITPEVEAIRERFGFPGMAILQFAFGNDPQAPTFRPHNYPRDVVAYTGTHDNDTTAGWWNERPEGDTRSDAEVAAERAFALEYLGADGREMHWTMMRAALASVADTVLIPAQDLLGLGSAARMNLPATSGRNWKWRLMPGALTPEIAARLARLTSLYGR